jgi:uncharacterized lipoprotein YddW (UPF0748 family)
MKKYTSRTLFSIIFLWLLNACGTSPATPTPPNPTPPKTPPADAVRGVWLTNVASNALYSREELKRAVQACADRGINHIFVVTWNKGWTQYPSEIMQRTFGQAIEDRLAGRDPLREILDEAKPKGIKVYAWFEYGFAAENSGLGSHILAKYPAWGALGSDGQVVSKNGFKWMNAFNKEVQDFMLSLLKECVQKYPDLEGIQGDDRLPALPSECGYNPDVIALYKAENGGAVPPNDPKNVAWTDWRAQKLNDFMRRLHTELKAIRPTLKISMAPSIFPFAKTEYLQDWPTWVSNGWVDMICPQVYRYNINDYRNELAKIVQQQVPTSKRDIVAPGVLLRVGTYSPTATFLQQMIDENRRAGLKGEVFFFYEGLQNHPDFFSRYSGT